jgi:hypothetical protein
MQGGHPQAMKVAKFIVRRISIRDTEISAGVSQKLMEGGQAQLVGRSPTPFPALILLLRMKKTFGTDIMESQKASLLIQERKS